MKTLAIDTTSMMGSVAICDGDAVVAIDKGKTARHAETLIQTIDELFLKTGFSKRDIEGISVAIGPGSFTGLRIGLAVAKGMALALHVPIAGVSSLKALALNGRKSKKLVLPLIDARRGEVYCSIFRFAENGGLPVCEMNECALSPSALVERLKAISEDLFAVGDGAIAFKKFFQKEMGKKFIFPDDDSVFPSAENLSILALEKLRDGGDDIARISLNYIRVSDAEIGFLGNLKKG